ncbi:DUF123 domain-containing protein [Candidatus Omnitrophota bacterium]
MKGSYIVLMKVEEECPIQVGRLGEINFHSGYYAYVGSAFTNLEKRIHRHFSTEKKVFWHIDYLLEKAEIFEALYSEISVKQECRIIGRMSEKFASVSGFGCSDCSCRSHLFYTKSREELYTAAREALAQFSDTGNIHQYTKR